MEKRLTKEMILNKMNEKEFDGEDIMMVIDGETYFVKSVEFLSDEVVEVVVYIEVGCSLMIMNIDKIERVDVI